MANPESQSDFYSSDCHKLAGFNFVLSSTEDLVNNKNNGVIELMLIFECGLRERFFATDDEMNLLKLYVSSWLTLFRGKFNSVIAFDLLQSTPFDSNDVEDDSDSER